MANASDISGLCLINVQSTLQSQKNKKDFSVQTMHLSTLETGVQTQSASIQDDDEQHRTDVGEGTDDRFAVPSASPAGSGWVYNGDHFDEQEVAEFLAGIHKDLTQELKQISKSSAFDGYEPGWKEKSSVGAKLVNTFPSPVFLGGGNSTGTSSGTATSSKSQQQQQQQQQQALQVTGISWNASSALVAASYGRVDSYTWSTGTGVVCIWPAVGPVVTAGSGDGKENEGGASSGDAGSKSSGKKDKKSKKSSGGKDDAVNSRSMLPGQNNNSSSTNDSEGPLIMLETDSFATSVAFHPTVPTLVAAATFSGEVLLWDISSTDDASASSVKPLCSSFGSHQQGGASGMTHHHQNPSTSSASSSTKDPVNKLVWIQNPREPRESHKYLLCSGSSDGTVAFWTPSNKFSEPVALGNLQNRRRASLGVQSLAFLSSGASSGGDSSSTNTNNTNNSSNTNRGRKIPTQEAPMILATDSGDVVRGKVPPKATAPVVAVKSSSSSKSSQQQQITPLNNTEFFETHSGPTNSVDASPFFRNVFLTCSSDGSVRLYSLLDMQHKLALVPSPDTKHFLYAASFSPVRPGVIATCSRSSQVHLFDLAQSRVKPAFTVDRAGTEDSAVLCLGWSAHGSSFATGDSKGCIRIWSVANSLCETTELERLAIRHSEKSAANKRNQQQKKSEDGGEEPESPGNNASLDNTTFSQSMLIAGRGGPNFDDQGNQAAADPIQMLLGFTP